METLTLLQQRACCLTRNPVIKHILFISILMLSQQVEAANSYTVTDLGTLGSPLDHRALGINSHGQIVGFAGRRAFLWEDNVMTDLGALAGDNEAQAHGINDLGHVVGRSVSGSDSRAFIWESGSMIDLGDLGYPHARASGINNAGQVVGTSITSGLEIRGFLWEQGSIANIGALPGHIGSNAVGINGPGQIVGFSESSNGSNAYLWDNGIITDLGTGRAFDINDSGQVVGMSNGHAAFWDNGTVEDLGTFGGTFSAARAINESGVIVGSASVAGSSGADRAFVYQDGSLIDLNSHLAPGSDEWLIDLAEDINDQGWIVGAGTFNGQRRAVLLRPEALEPINIDIDIPDSINLKSKGVLPVSVLATDDFDVADINIDSLLFGDPILINAGATPVSPIRSAFEDITGDGLLDLALKFAIPEMVEAGVLGPLSTQAVLTGKTFDGVNFLGRATVRIVPAHVPEPSTVLLAALAILGLLGFRCRHQESMPTGKDQPSRRRPALSDYAVPSAGA